MRIDGGEAFLVNCVQTTDNRRQTQHAGTSSSRPKGRMSWKGLWNCMFFLFLFYFSKVIHTPVLHSLKHDTKLMWDKPCYCQRRDFLLSYIAWFRCFCNNKNNHRIDLKWYHLGFFGKILTFSFFNFLTHLLWRGVIYSCTPQSSIIYNGRLTCPGYFPVNP